MSNHYHHESSHSRSREPPTRRKCTKSFGNLFLEAVIFIAIFIILGHMTVNLWERVYIKSEITKMKNSLTSLKVI